MFVPMKTKRKINKALKQLIQAEGVLELYHFTPIKLWQIIRDNNTKNYWFHQN